VIIEDRSEKTHVIDNARGRRIVPLLHESVGLLQHRALQAIEARVYAVMIQELHGDGERRHTPLERERLVGNGGTRERDYTHPSTRAPAIAAQRTIVSRSI
jgi:hypothetical protein